MKQYSHKIILVVNSVLAVSIASIAVFVLEIQRIGVSF